MKRELLNLKPVLDLAQQGRYAVGAFNFVNAETARAVIEEASRQRAPLILITAPWESDLVGTELLVDIVRWLTARADVPVCLHLDHATDVESVRRCIEAGFPSVMIDASQLPFDENVRQTRLVVEMARERGITVEGELGAVGKVDDAAVEGGEHAALTDPDVAAEYVALTGVDALAVAIGNAHGMYTQRPVLDFARLEAIAKAVDVPLVLHGGSGTEPDQLRRAIEIGIRKVNVASELCRAFLRTVHDRVAESQNKIWYATALSDARDAVSEVTGRWMHMLGCAGKV